MNKKTKKTVKPEFIFSAYECDSVEDLYIGVIYGKVAANKPIDVADLEFITKSAVINELVEQFTEAFNDAFNTLNNALQNCECECLCNTANCTPKKKPWYKRFWNWLRGKRS